MVNQIKKIALIVNLVRNPNIKVSSLIADKVLSELSSSNYYGAVLLNSDKALTVNLNPNRVITFIGDSLEGPFGYFEVPTLGNDQPKQVSLSNLTHLLPIEEFSFTIMGVDSHMNLTESVRHLSFSGYDCSVRTSLIKSNRDLTYSSIRRFCHIINDNVVPA